MKPKIPGLGPLFRRSLKIWAANPFQVLMYLVIPTIFGTIAFVFWNDAYEVLVGLVAIREGKPEMSPAQQLIPGLTLIFTMMAAGTVAMRISQEREIGSWRRFLVAPIWRPALPLSWVLAAYVLFAAAPLVVIFVYARVVFGMMVGDWFGVLLILSVFSLVPVGLGLFLASWLNSQGMLQMVAVLISVLLASVGGAMVPAALFDPGWQQFVAHLTPHYWYLDSVQGLMTHEKGLIDVLPAIGALLAYALALGATGLAILHRREYL